MTIGQLVTPTLKLVRQIGEGAMGTVWKAENLKLGSFYAVKKLVREYADSEKSVARFKEEAQRAARISNPHVTKVFDYGVTTGDEPYIVMELLKGETLGACIKRCGALPAEEVADLIGQTADGLVAAHAEGIVHRDVKPANLFIVDNAGRPFIMIVDFGIAKQMDSPPTKTTTGLMIGTPAYMSPEQYLNPKEVDHRSDLWSLGIVAYEAMTGTRPFDGPTIFTLATAITEYPFTPPSEIKPDLPKAIDDWMLKALAKRREDRFASAMEMAEALMKIAPPPRRQSYTSWPPKPEPASDVPTAIMKPLQHVFINPAGTSGDAPFSMDSTMIDNPPAAMPALFIARRGDMKTLPFPRERAPMLVARTFDAAMVARIEAGILPRTADDPWFVFTENNRVYFYRSPAGTPMYEVWLEPTPSGGKRIAEAWVAANRRPMQNTQRLSQLFDELFDKESPPVSIRFDTTPPAQRIWIYEGDILTLGVDALVNAADPSLLGGAGLDGDVHRAAGSGLLAECRGLGGCHMGEAKMTKGHSLMAKHVIHTVGPVWTGGSTVERFKLAACYTNSLALAAKAELRTIAFPSISTGTKRFPLDEAAFIAAKATLDFLAKKTSVELVVFCTFTPAHTNAARRALAKAIGG